MPPFPSPALPAACADCLTTLHPAKPGAAAVQSASKLFRSSDGKTRVDYGNTSVITNPAAPHTIVLDHLKKEARLVPLPSAPALPGFTPPGMPAAPLMPAVPPPNVHVRDLGKALIEGHEVQGKQYTFQPPPLSQPPAPPHLPGTPKLPQMPQMPAPPAPPSVAEVWTSTTMHVPVLTKVSGGFGQQVSHYKNVVPEEPHASLFQIPAGYRQLPPPPGVPR